MRLIQCGTAKAIANNATEAELRLMIRSQGVASLTVEALRKVQNGITSFDEANPIRWL